MKMSLLIMLLSGLIGVAVANAEPPKPLFVDIRMINAFADPITIWVTDVKNGNKTDKNQQEITHNGDSISKAMLDAKGYIEMVIAIHVFTKKPDENNLKGDYCLRVATNAKDIRELKYSVSKDNTKPGAYC